jgi:hypothetical protein
MAKQGLPKPQEEVNTGVSIEFKILMAMISFGVLALVAKVIGIF